MHDGVCNLIEYWFFFLFILLSMSIRLLYSAKEPVSVLVFEDMTMHGYGVSSGTLNFEGVKFVAKKLAKFHATSFYMGKQVRNLFETQKTMQTLTIKTSLSHARVKVSSITRMGSSI